jgi:hypothetical protein
MKNDMQRHNIPAVDSGLSLKIEKEKQFMLKSRTTIVASLFAVCLLAATWAFGQSGNKAEAQGMIISRTGETLIVKTSDGGKTTVVLTDATKVQDRRGLFGLDKQQLADTILMPGLKLKAKGTTDDQGRIVAKTIMTDGDDIETAEMIEAGLHPTPGGTMDQNGNLSGTPTATGTFLFTVQVQDSVGAAAMANFTITVQ